MVLYNILQSYLGQIESNYGKTEKIATDICIYYI